MYIVHCQGGNEALQVGDRRQQSLPIRFSHSPGKRGSVTRVFPQSYYYSAFLCL